MFDYINRFIIVYIYIFLFFFFLISHLLTLSLPPLSLFSFSFSISLLFLTLFPPSSFSFHSFFLYLSFFLSLISLSSFSFLYFLLFIFNRLIYSYNELENHGIFKSLPQFPIITRVAYRNINNICMSMSSQSFIVKLQNGKSFIIITRQRTMTLELIQLFQESCNDEDGSLISDQREFEVSLIQVYY